MLRVLVTLGSYLTSLFAVFKIFEVIVTTSSNWFENLVLVF